MVLGKVYSFWEHGGYFPGQTVATLPAGSSLHHRHPHGPVARKVQQGAKLGIKNQVIFLFDFSNLRAFKMVAKSCTKQEKSLLERDQRNENTYDHKSTCRSLRKDTYCESHWTQ